MVRLARTFRAVGLCLALFAAAPALAGQATPPEVRALIQRQLDAFAQDDAAGAYALTSPGLREVFTDSNMFMRMVRDHYEPVYRHRDVEFFDFSDKDGKYEQTLTIVDDDNNVWTAIYMLDREPDGTWRTSGCVLVKSVESSL